KPLTITATAQSKTYGTALSLGTSAFTVGSGLVGSESVTAVTLTANGGTAATDAVGSYTITLSAATRSNGFLASNYSPTLSPYTPLFRSKPLTITATAQSKTYGTALSLGTSAFTVGSGLVGSESVTAVTLTANGGTAATDAVGSYTI